MEFAGNGVVGELYTPAGAGPHPLVIYMNGSSGGVNAPRAALFASRGYQCLALALFNYDGRPRYLNDMPLQAFLTALRDAQAVARARIPVERFPGPLMLVSASDDGFWPSTAFCELIVRRRQAAGDLPTRHHVCEGAGHHVHYPYLPATLISKPHPMSGLLLDGGGTPAANARGNESSYRAVLAFLDEAQARATR